MKRRFYVSLKYRSAQQQIDDKRFSFSITLFKMFLIALKQTTSEEYQSVSKIGYCLNSGFSNTDC
jgi:hypothetical protein